jgi:hypothetical protein
MQKVNFILVAFLCVLSACVTQRKCTLKFPPSVKRDSIYVETVKEIPVLIPGDTVNVEVPINCPDQDLVNIETSSLKQQIKILKGKLVSNTLIKPDTVFVPVIETKTVVKEITVPEPVKFIPQRFKTYRNIVFFIFALGFAFVGYKLYSFFKPKIKI